MLSRYSFPPLCLFLFVFGFVVKQAAKATGRDHCLDENDRLTSIKNVMCPYFTDARPMPAANLLSRPCDSNKMKLKSTVYCLVEVYSNDDEIMQLCPAWEAKDLIYTLPENRALILHDELMIK